MKRLVIVVMFGIIGGNILKNSEEYSQAHPLVYVAEAQVIEPRVVLIGTTTKEKTIEQKIRDTFPEDPETALKIAKCESGLNPKAKSPTNDHGVMQINLTVHKEQVHEMGLDVYNVDDNLKFARFLYEERKWEPWVCKDLI